MIVTILYGRSWQNVEAATKAIGNAAFASGFHVQDFLSKKDASHPVAGCVKMDRQLIESRQYELLDNMLVFDERLEISPLIRQMKENAHIIINSREKASNPLFKKLKLRVFSVDAAGIAVSTTGQLHAAMLGAFTRACGRVPEKSVKLQLEGKKDTAAFEEGMKSVKKG